MSGSGDDLFREMFFEEAGELLATLEKGLTGLSQGPVDRAKVDPVYRAAHSLKGAAAMVGLATVSELALAMERSLSQVRSGALGWAPELASALAAERERLAAEVAQEERQFRSSSK